MSEPQSYKNHTRFDPLFHFTVMPLLLLNLGFSIYATIHSWPSFRHTHLWWIVMSFVFIFIAGVARTSALKAQDRIIRLEERQRLASLLSPDEAHLIPLLTERQLIALRFASDEELPALAHKAVTHSLDSKTIKQSIVNWRADHFRV